MAEKYSNEKIASNKVDSDKDDSQKKIVAGIAATEAAVVSTRQAAVEYAQPNTYTGNRALYDSASAKRQAKEAAFYNVPIDVDMNFDPNPILWTLENTLIPIRGHQTVPLL